MSVGKSIDHYVVAVAKAISADIARQNFRRDLHGAHQTKASFGSRHLGLSFDYIAGESSRHDEFKRAQLQSGRENLRVGLMTILPLAVSPSRLHFQ